MKLVLIRHPQPEVDVGICYGKTDLLLREPAAQSAAEIFSQLNQLSNQTSTSSDVQQPLQRIACSPLTRCKQLGIALAALQPNSKIHFDDRLQELDFGNWEMQPWNSIGKAQMDAWIASGFDAIHGGESLQAMDARVASWLQDARDSYPPDQPLWVIAHAGAIRSLLRQQKICSFNDSLSWPIGYSEFIELNLDSITTNQPP